MSPYAPRDTINAWRSTVKYFLMNKYVVFALWAGLLFLVVSCARNQPEISAAPAHVKSGDQVILTGTGFTPRGPVMSHLLKPNGTEYNPLRLHSDASGKVVHKIDTTMLDLGTFELWAEDETSKATSNRTRFTVE